MQFERTIDRPGLEQQHRDGGVLAQPRGERRPRRAGPDDDVVGFEVAAAMDARTRSRTHAAAHAPKALTSTTDIAAPLPSMRNRVKPSHTAAPVRDVTNHGGFGRTDSP